MRFALALPAIWTALAAMLFTGQELVAATALVVVLIGAAIGPRGALSRGNQVMAGSFLLLFAAAIAWLLPATDGLLGLRAPASFRVAVTLGALFIAAFRAYVKDPLGGAQTTVALSVIGAIGMGGLIGAGNHYAVYLAGLALVSLLALRSVDRGRAPIFELGRKNAILSALVLLATLGVTWLLAQVLPPVHDSVQAFAIEHLDLGLETRRSGFSRTMGLGSLRKIIKSNAKVLRVEGAFADHLRGVVYDRYVRGQWVVPIDDRPHRVRLTDRMPLERHVEIQSIGDESARYFLPLEAEEIGVPNGAAEADGMGVLAPADDERADRIWFSVPTASIARNRPPIARPSPTDRLVPEELSGALSSLAAQWTRGLDGDRAKLDAINRRLQTEYTYALEFSRDEKKDPILEFLFDRKTGHCEYFASSMALLARTSSIATRVAGGFLVTERSSLGDSWIVRQSNAHAWVEAWVDGAWVTFDPTPPSGIAEHMAQTAPAFDAIGELISDAGRRAFRWLKARTVAQILPAIAFALAIVFRTELRGLFRRRQQQQLGVLGTYSAPSPALLEMLGVLEREGLHRGAGETLEDFANRIRDSEARALLAAYTAQRYGGVGDRDQIERAISAWVRR